MYLRRILTFIVLCLLVIPASLSLSSQRKYTPYPGPGTLVQHLSVKYNRPEDEIRKVVLIAHMLARHDMFPTPLDILAVIAVESGFKSSAKSADGGNVGYMQINSIIHKIPVLQLNNPQINVEKGYDILVRYRKLAGSDQRALVFYNAGPGKGLEICPSNEACRTDYSVKVSQLKAEFSKHAANTAIR